MRETARRAFVATVVVLGVLAVALALWKLRLIVALVFLGLIISAAMRPAVEALRSRGVPRGATILMHYVAIAGLVALFLWQVVPTAVNQVSDAIGGIPTSRSEVNKAAKNSTGFRHTVLVAIKKRLKKLPSAGNVYHASVNVTKRAFEVLIGIFFVFAVAAYWIYERDRAIRVVLSLLPRERRRVVRDTWDLIDAKLGAFVRGELILIAFVSTVLSIAFWAIGLRFWLLLGIFAGIVEIIPVIGPLIAGGAAVAVGFTSSWHVALAAGIAVLAVRLLEDYIVVPRVMGHAVGLSPLLVLIGATSAGLLFGAFFVLVATPILAVLVTLVDVIVRDKDPAKEEVPAVLFPAKDAEV
jgi:predicted PurR-regulated permease PerM